VVLSGPSDVHDQAASGGGTRRASPNPGPGIEAIGIAGGCSPAEPCTIGDNVGVPDAELDEWLAGLGAPGSAHIDAAVLAWLRSLFETYGPLDSTTFEVAYRLRAAELAKWATDLVSDDVRRTTNLSPSIDLVEFDRGDVIPSYNGNYSGSSVMSVDPATVLVEVADQLQEGIVEDRRQGWPACHVHDSGAFAELHDGLALWWCRKGKHPLAEIGTLGTRPA